jgi:hypothetical protein
MIIAQEKRKTNIAEYIIYMWQVEDLIRALNFDMEKIKTTLVAQYDVDDKQRSLVVDWYSNLNLMIVKEQIQKTGHLQFLSNLTNDLNLFHKALLQQNIDVEYSRLYSEIQADIELVRKKSGKDDHDIDVALNTLYLILMLKMKEQKISEGTQSAVWKFGNFMGQLSKLFKAYEADELDMTY